MTTNGTKVYIVRVIGLVLVTTGLWGPAHYIMGTSAGALMDVRSDSKAQLMFTHQKVAQEIWFFRCIAYEYDSKAIIKFK